LRAPSRAGSIGRSARRSISVGLSILVVALMVVGGLSVLATAHGPTALAAPSHTTAAASPFTHGDLLVTPGERFVIQPTPGTHTYFQGGNITVERGGTLIVRNVTLSFVQFVSNTGTPVQRLSHIFRFIDNGTVNLYNSTVTTDVSIINAYAKLNVTVLNDMTAWNSTFAFPGWLNVEGASADLTLNSSRITSNPVVGTLSGFEPNAIFGDTLYAPSVTVVGGAELNAFNSSIIDTYADNTNAFGHAQPVPLGLPGNPALVPIGLGNHNFSALSTPTDAANLSQDWLYPNADFQAGNLIVNWTNPNSATSASVDANVWYDGSEYAVAVGLNFASGGSGSFLLPLPANLLQNITQDGVLNYLNWTGDFGAGPSKIAIDFDVVSGPAVVNVSSEISLLPSVDYNVMFSGAGSTLNSIDTSFGLNWDLLPANSTSQTHPFPWGSNKLLLTDGAVAFLANDTVLNPLPGVFSTSAVLPDAASQAYFYRWAQFNLTGRGGFLPIPDAQVKAYYAYSTKQTDNATANALNDLAISNPEIWGYVQYWDAQHGVQAYGESNVTGRAAVLLASSNLTGPTLPDGLFLGGYHIGVIVPAVGVSPHWFNWSVSPYPEGVAQSPPAVAGPDFGPVQQFNQYFGAVVVTSVTVLANGVASPTVYLGQTLDARVLVTDIGTAPIDQVQGTLLYNTTGLPSALLATYENTTLHLTTPGQQTTFNLDWRATKNITGINAAFAHNFTAIVDWNYNNATLAGGNLTQNVSVTFSQTIVTVASATVQANGLDNTTVELGQTLGVEVTVNDVGNGTINELSAWLYYNATTVLASYENTSPHLAGPGQSVTFTLTWKATENITGLHGWFDYNLSLALSWNNNSGSTWLGNGNFAQNVSMKFAPSEIAFTSFVPPTSPLDLSTTYFSTGILAYNGSHPALIELFATPVNGGSPVTIAGTAALPGPFSMQWSALTGLLIPGTTYVLKAMASYNSRETNYTLPGTYSVPPSPSSPASFLFQTFLGLPLWVWIAIAAAAVVAILLFLFVARRQAAGKLVECGECGSLIPEDATICPKCGAEFETDLIRCSRCASTIPADSKFCPECAAQLLGTPGEAESDPEKQAYADFTEKYRAEAKKELGDNYSEGAFWDWWKRQPTYTPFSQWSLQQGQGTARAGMTAPPVGTQTTPESDAGRMPPKGGGGSTSYAGTGAASTSATAAPTPPSTSAAVPPPAAGGAGLKACPSCGKEIPTEYLVCPFCNAVTQ
jgi:RNA polymerase subunit RPABC4/transcription elongation factor Spt4